MAYPHARALSAAVPSTGQATPSEEARLSLAELYDLHADFVYRSLIRLGVPQSHGEDAMQEVFIVANRHLPSFEGTFYKAWLFRLADSVARNVRRSTRRTQSPPIELGMLVEHGASPFDEAALAQQRRLLHLLLERLTQGQREVFVLSELEELPHLEIAAALGVHVNTVANRLNAARVELERLLRQHEHNTTQGNDR